MPPSDGIAAQCCTSGTGNAACRRRATDDGGPSTDDKDCIAGALNSFQKMTYGDTKAKCDTMGLELCRQSCSGQGCQYNFHPVYTGLPCSLPSPSPPPPAIPAHGYQVFYGDKEKQLFCLGPGHEGVTSYRDDRLDFTPPADAPGNEGIAAQCCTSGGACRRRATANGGESSSNNDCVAGMVSKNNFQTMTFFDTKAMCEDRGLQLCSKSCAGSGCYYNSHPVYTGIPCKTVEVSPSPPSPPPPSPSPPPPPPSPPPPIIPPNGVKVLAGDLAGVNQKALFCLGPDDEDVTSFTDKGLEKPPRYRDNIAGQCCTSGGDCRRRATKDGGPSNKNKDCVAGAVELNDFRKMTYGDTKTMCEGMGLELCGQSCSGQGCWYNHHPVYSNLPCTEDSPPPPSPPVVDIPEAGVKIVAGNNNGQEACLYAGMGHESVTLATEVRNGGIPGVWNQEIAAQCCTSGGECRRRAKDNGDASNSNGDCIAGVKSQGTFITMTYGDAKTACEDRGLQLCKKVCKDKGCNYNIHPVWTGWDCPRDPGRRATDEGST